MKTNLNISPISIYDYTYMYNYMAIMAMQAHKMPKHEEKDYKS